MCLICHKMMDKSAGIEIGNHSDEDISGPVPDYAHQTCIEREFAAVTPLRCRDCREVLKSVSALDYARLKAVCSHCGSVHPFDSDSPYHYFLKYGHAKTNPSFSSSQSRSGGFGCLVMLVILIVLAASVVGAVAAIFVR